jgi:Uma2 family endonuclease
MATTSNKLTFAAFEQLPDGDGMHRELIEGELQILPPPKSTHTVIAKRALKLLLAIEDRADGQAFPEAGYKLSNDPSTWIQPDVSFLKNERVRATPEGSYFLGAPELAVEVVSPSESARDLKRKINLLLKGGSQAVWVIYPEDRTVEIYRPDGTSYTTETLSAPGLLPEWTSPAASLFED